MDSTRGRQHVSSVEPFSREMIGSGEIMNKPADKCPIFWAPKHSHWKGLDTVCRPESPISFVFVRDIVTATQAVTARECRFFLEVIKYLKWRVPLIAQLWMYQQRLTCTFKGTKDRYMDIKDTIMPKPGCEGQNCEVEMI